MDEKPADSSPSNTTHQRNNDSTPAGGTRDSRSPGAPSQASWTFVSQAHYDPDQQRDLTTVIISAIVEAEEVPITEIKSPPLYVVVDVTGIDDALFGRLEANRKGTESTIEFRYNQYDVSVEADGWVTVSLRT